MSTNAHYTRSIMWFRRDLRLEDNNALAHAANYSDEAVAVFVFDTNILEKLKKDDRRLSFIQESLEDMRAKLKSMASDIIILHGDPVLEIPKLANKIKAQAVFANRDYEIYAKERDIKVRQGLRTAQIDFHTYKDSVIFESNEVKTKEDNHYRVFTAYKNQWLKVLKEKPPLSKNVNLKKMIAAKSIAAHVDATSMESIGFKQQKNIIVGGRTEALRLWADFLKKIDKYKATRDFPALEGTSFLSPYLRFGCISPRELVREVCNSKKLGQQTWLSEIIWRDFYQMILDVFSHVDEGKVFKENYDHLKWPGKEKDFQAWCDGMTGYPLIDASMRYFKQTGWMHNRLRMVVAMFLTKDLLVDWHKGEAYFASLLLDFDKASNNGGWQWSASTGCDAQPYFRIFNPYSQSEKFDPKGEFIRKHCPELAKFPDKYIHRPDQAPAMIQQMAECAIGKDYPFPIVKHEEQRLKALALFKK